MKKIIAIAAALTALLCTGCNSEPAEPAAEFKPNIAPQQAQMKNICELAAFDCYYHNVAKYFEKDAEGALFWKKDRRFWIEYSGIVTIGIDVSKADFTVSGDTVKITLPPAEVQSCRVDPETLTSDAFIIDTESAAVEASHQTAAFNEAQANMEKAASEDTVLLENARSRAKQLLEGYVNNVGEIVGVDYKIQWIYPDKPQNTVSTEG